MKTRKCLCGGETVVIEERKLMDIVLWKRTKCQKCGRIDYVNADEKEVEDESRGISGKV